MRSWGAWTVAPVLCLCGCGEPDPVVTTARLELALPAASGCRPAAAPEQLEVRALGDLPAAETDRFIEVLRLGDSQEPWAIDRFPLETRVVTLRALGPWGGAGLLRLGDDDQVAPVMLLPLGRSCALADLDVRAPPGSALAPLPDGGFLIVGGEMPKRLLRVHPAGGPLAEVLTLFDARVGASATLVSGRVVIAGGEDADTWEVFDPATGEVERQPEWVLPSHDTAPPQPGVRSRHAAVALDDGSVLLVGGLGDESDVPLHTAVRIDLASGTAEPWPGELEIARYDARILRLDDGRLFVAGGRRATDAPDNTVDYVDLDAESFVRVPQSFDEGDGAVMVALPGARIAWLGNGGRAEVWSFAERGPTDPAVGTVELSEPLPPLGPDEVTVLADGDVLTSGGLVVDLGTGRVTRTEGTPGRRLVPLADGTLAEVGESGASRRRQRLRTEFDNPPATLLPTDTEWLALDPVGGFVHLPTLRFASVRISPRLDGDADLQLRDESGHTERIAFFPDGTELGPCRLDHAPGAEITIERDADEILLRTPTTERRCRAPLQGRVSISFQLYGDATLHSLGVERL